MNRIKAINVPVEAFLCKSLKTLVKLSNEKQIIKESN